MKRNFLIPFFILFVSSCNWNKPKSVPVSNYGKNDTVYIWKPDLEAITPVQFLDSIRIVNCNGRRSVILVPFSLANNESDNTIGTGVVPRDWIKREHLELLIQLLDDRSLTFPVFSAAADLSATDKPYTTVGIEALRLIQGYMDGIYPSLWPEYYAKDTVSVQFKNEKHVVIDWWNKNK